ncbi:MAG TPA: 2-hydroxyacid dehydrogenase [Bacillota bacterium]|nr:2-hydroxyacid dehydrogenase [Bacillota bacterium]HOB86536.1 2-hydroxyacid dehydrogenase [Bacillota bacterium]HOP68403.1 2-hydroxyacid dehydrogenase [Bacillota bacterium]HPT33509.1 2-hydroxyacid dehydrogenase [Bacillota bacterium]HPZ65352.1 2-hydroxyacid dehydrogenase [Bacillota bacterium]
MNFLVTAGLVPESIAALEKWGKVRYEYFGEKMHILGGRKLIAALQEVDVFITEADQVRKPVLQAAPRLKVIGCCRGNPVNIDIPAATERGIPVLITPGRNAVSVAELTIAFMISLARNVFQTAAMLRERQPGAFSLNLGKVFLEYKGMEIHSKTVGLIGLGAVGREVARRLVPFGCRLLAYDPYVKEVEPGVEMVPLEQLLRESDFVSIHAAVTEETRGLLRAEQFAMMKQGAFLINLARAAIIDEEALAEALQKGHLGGAALDVFSQEPPPPDHPLLQLDNVIATPHIGGNTHDVIRHQSRIIVEDLIRLFESRSPKYCVNPQVLDSFSI